MNKMDRVLKHISLGLGAAAGLFLLFSAYVFARLMPKMTALDPISAAEENMFLWVGGGLLVYLAFSSVSVLRAANYIRHTEDVPLLAAGQIITGVLAFLFVFSDLALLNDIGKQYRHGLAQPEWMILITIMLFQMIALGAFIYLHLFGFKAVGLSEPAARDSNIFLIVQYVGALCGLLGLALSSMGFFFPRAWTLEAHTTFTVIVMMIPYALAAGYWLMTKLREQPRQFFDEKQKLDTGRAALVTVGAGSAFMLALFIANYRELSGVVSVLWLPLYLFAALLVFSSANIYFALKVK